MNQPPQPPPTFSPDYAAGPHQVDTGTPKGGASDETHPREQKNTTTKIENPFDVFLHPATTISTTTTNEPHHHPSVPIATKESSNTGTGNWFSLMNEGAATLDVFQLLPAVRSDSSTGSGGRVVDNTTSTTTTHDTFLPPPILLEPKRSMDTTTTANSIGFDRETYSYDEEMSAIYTANSRAPPHPIPEPLHTLSEEETYVTNETETNSENAATSTPQQPPVITMTSLMTSTGISTMEPPPGPPPPIMYHTYDYSDVAMMPTSQSHLQQQPPTQNQIPPNATFDSAISSMGNDDIDALDLAPTTSSDIVRQHEQNANTRMVSIGTGSVVIVETVRTASTEEASQRNATTTEEPEDDDEQLAARIMFVLQGAAAMNATGANDNDDDLPIPHNHLSMTDSQIYTCGSDTAAGTTTIGEPRSHPVPGTEAHAIAAAVNDDDDDVDNILPATISIPSLSSPLSQQQQERQHIVLNPVFNYASSSDDGDHERFFGDTDTEDDDVIPARIQQEVFGVVDGGIADTYTAAPFPTTMPEHHRDDHDDDKWRHATPAVAMTAAGLAGTAGGAILLNQHAVVDSSVADTQGLTPPSPHGKDNVRSKMAPVTTTDYHHATRGEFPRESNNDNYKDDPNQENDNGIHHVEDRKKRWMSSSCSWILCLCLLLLLVGIALLIYFLVRNDNSPRDNAVPTAPTTTTTSIPTPVTVPAPVTPTLAPTIMPTLSTRDVLFLELQNVSNDNGTAMNTSDTPQNKAFQWLLSDPQLVQYDTNKRIVRYALATFYYSTGGPVTNDSNATTATTTAATNTSTTSPTLWLDNNLWLSYEDECTWYTRARSGLCGPLHRNNQTNGSDTKVAVVVQNLDVSYNNLQGTLPPEIGLLSTLHTFSVGGGPDTTLMGSVPFELGQLSLLKELRLPYNQITGRIPASIGECTLLQSIDLSNNHFRGLIPSDIGMMTNLVTLSLDHNAFQGPIPTTIGQCTGVKTLNLAHNTLALLPTEIYQLSNLIFLDVQNNTLGGSIRGTSALGSLSNINTILLSQNELTGSIPTEFNLLSNLKVLDLSYNALSGTIPYGFVNENITTNSSNVFIPADNETETSTLLLNPLRVLQLNHNRLSGQVPESFRELSNLQVLHLHSNLLNGSMPTVVCEAFNVTRATVSVDCLNVDCPCCIFCCNTMEEDAAVVSTTIQDDFDDVCICRHWNTTMEWLCY